MNKLAPIVLFVYDRLWHTQQTIEALKKNKFADKSELFIFSDAPKSNENLERVEKVREYIKSINGFMKIHIILREENWGLAKSIIEGVSTIVNKFGKIIVLEDDIVTSPTFLVFMNEALNFYQKNQKIWHISGWNYPIDYGDEDVFMWRGMECWGWGTWKDRWQFFDKNPALLIGKFEKEDIFKFNIDNKRDNWRQVVLNHKKKMNTWAVFWYATIYLNDGLSVNPTFTFVKNIGLDGTGENCSGIDIFSNDLNQIENFKLYHSNTESQYYLNEIKTFSDNTKVSLIERVINKIIKVILR